MKKYVQMMARWILCLGICISMTAGLLPILAKETSETLVPNVYQSTDSYVYKKETKNNEIKPVGKMSVTADITDQSGKGTSLELMIKEETALNISYSVSKKDIPASWELCDDGSKSAGKISLDQKIGNGALILQTSLDNSTWITNLVKTNIFDDTSLSEAPFYTASDIQLNNGSYYRILVVYQIRKLTEEKSLGPINMDKYEYQNRTQIYKFFAKTDGITTAITDSPRTNLGETVKTDFDSGFYGSNSIDEKDPHYGWDLGRFVLNGYTRQTKDSNSNPVFLKNVGDNITLWFSLEQDINALNGNEDLKISEDVNGYDRELQTSKTNFKHGALLIQQTDNENYQSDPIIYTDFLAANAMTGADTRVQLFEEGDYCVILDYEIEDSRSSIPGKKDYTNYKIAFDFSIRNGNCMVFPFDLQTGSELEDGDIAEEGFYLDLAKSRYLDIDVTRYNVKKDSSGGWILEQRFNRPASDGEEYTDPGKYVFNVSNRYTGQNTTKTIYVGLDRETVNEIKNK